MLFKFQFPSSNRIRFQEFSKEQFLVFAAEAAKKLKWELTLINESELVFRTPSNWFKWGKTIYVKIEEVPLNENDIAAGKKLLVYCTSKRKGKKLLEEVEKGMSALTIDQISSKVSDFENSGGFQANFDSGNVLVDQRTWWQKLLALFQIGKNYVATPILLYINVGVFVVMLLTNKGDLEFDGFRLISWGGDFLPETLLRGQWWRFISANFLHADLHHLAGNMIGLLFVGFLLEKYIGSKRFILSYVGVGFLANFLSLFFYPVSIKLGSSGGILSLFGILLVLSPNLIKHQSLQKVLVTIAAVYALMPFVISFIIFDKFSIYESDINHVAHFTGFACGLFLGFAFSKSITKGKTLLVKIASYSVVILAAFTVFMSTSLYFVTRSELGTREGLYQFLSRREPVSPIMIKRINEMNVTPRSREFYTEKMNRFVTMESMALEVLNYSSEDSEKYINDLKNRGIYYWNENIALLREFDQLNLPASLSEKHKLLEDYCNLNIRLYELKHLKATEKSNKYDEAIYNYQLEIEELINAIRRK